MADWDANDLLTRLKRVLQRPATEETAKSVYWGYLTEAEIAIANIIAAHAPASNYGDPTKLTTADSGLTYTFPSSIYPMGHAEIKPSKTGEPLVEVAEWDCGADGFVQQGNKIRWPCQRKRTFSDGPYARFMTPPTGIDGDLAKEPTINPPDARILVVYRAAAMWARRGGLRDPRPYEEEENRLAWGDPMKPGDVGIIARLKLQYAHAGYQAIRDDGGRWYRSIDTGAGYQPTT